MQYDEENLIVYLCKKAEKIGDTSAKAIAEYFDCSIVKFSFLESNFEHFKNSSGKPKLSNNQINGLQNIIKIYIKDNSQPINNIWISVLIRDFVRHSISELQKTQLENLLINPFLVKAFGFDDHNEVVTLITEKEKRNNEQPTHKTAHLQAPTHKPILQLAKE